MPVHACISGADKHYNLKRILAGRDLPRNVASSTINVCVCPPEGVLVKVAQALRNSVIYRKVTGGFRSDWGAELYANLISMLETARRQDVLSSKPFENLMQSPCGAR